MYKQSGRLIFSPSDLTQYMESPFASWMERYVLEFPQRAPARDEEDALLSALAEKGFDHESSLERQFIADGKQLVQITGTSSEQKLKLTQQAMVDGVDVIAQARLESDCFAGYADFLVRINHRKSEPRSRLGNYHYEVWDAKLANKVKPTFVVQLCCYSQLLETYQGILPEWITIALGNGTRERLTTKDYFAYYQTFKKAFLNLQQYIDLEQRPDPADSRNWGHWRTYAEQLLLEQDHLFQVANISKSQIKKLNKAGISRMQQLANLGDASIAGIHSSQLQKLKDQAKIQVCSLDKDVPLFEIIPPEPGAKMGLALLPPHSPLDVFFDIEGYPLDEGGLEYLWGCTYFNDSGEREFKDFWAHNRIQEQAAFRNFIQWVYGRWLQDPTMHIYHYANYEIAACRKLMGRYGVCEKEVDQLLRNEVFVDLYKIVKGGLLLGEPRYSIKNVEHLYRDKRQTQVGNGGDSVAVYEHWRTLNQLGEQGNTWQDSSILHDIRLYNIDDCNSTQELVDWLRIQQRYHHIDYLGKIDVVEEAMTEEVSARTELRDQLLNQAAVEKTKYPLQAQLKENLAWMLEFHRREAKPIFWRLFERMGLNHEDLMDDLDCLANCQRTQKPGYKPSPRARNLAYEYEFNPHQEFKGVAQRFYLLGVEQDDGRLVQVNYVREHSNLEKGIIALQAKQEPPQFVSLVPDEFVNPDPIPQAIQFLADEFSNQDLANFSTAIIDFLSRSKPRFKLSQFAQQDGDAIAESVVPEERLRQIIDAVKNLDNSYLTIQGPPGAGKSYTGTRVIAELLTSGARVGIASNSHKAINNLLLSTATYCIQQKINGHFVCTKDSEPELQELGVTIVKNNELANCIVSGCVLGTTAWGFARDDMANQLDYLFVDEAGQVSVANLVAMSRSANNLILMGDQMQLGQPSQGSHPAESGLSVLDYLLHEMATVPENMGIFLGTTYRMHSQVNHFISHYIYDDKLLSHPANDKRIITVPDGYEGPLDKEAGVTFVPVEHQGNSQASDEEVETIKRLASSLLGRKFYTGKGDEDYRLIGWQDMLFVAPYNHQVSKLRAALGEQAKVGSVDKFQGQEAPVVFLSMCTSDAGESPRGVDFLFDKHRLNVAISRAQTLAVVVANPAIGLTMVEQVEQMKLINLFNAIVLAGQ